MASPLSGALDYFGGLEQQKVDARQQQAQQQRQMLSDFLKQQQENATNQRLQGYLDLAKQKQTGSDQARDAYGKLYQKLGTLPANATPNDAAALASEAAAAGVPAASIQDAMRLRGFGFSPKGVAGGDTVLKQVYNPDTGINEWTYVPKSAPAGSTVGQVKPAQGGNPVALINVTAKGMGQLSNQIDALKLSPGEMNVPNWIQPYSQRAGIAPNDPRLSGILGQASVIEATLTGLIMRTWGSRNPVAAEKYIQLHVPHPTDSPALMKQKMDHWMAPGGYLSQYRGMAGASDTSDARGPTMLPPPPGYGGAAPASGSAGAARRPVFLKGKLLGYTTDGRTLEDAP